LNGGFILLLQVLNIDFPLQIFKMFVLGRIPFLFEQQQKIDDICVDWNKKHQN